MFDIVRAKRHSVCKNCGNLIEPGEMCLEWSTHSFYGGRLCEICLKHAHFACNLANDPIPLPSSDYQDFINRREMR